MFARGTVAWRCQVSHNFLEVLSHGLALLAEEKGVSLFSCIRESGFDLAG